MEFQNLLADLKKKNFTSLFISHDLSVVKYICNKTAVMYLGHIVEFADKKALYEHPAHPYTRALLAAIPIPRAGGRREHVSLPGELPSPLQPPAGCPFHTRCPYAKDICCREYPEWRQVEENHWCACHCTDLRGHGEGL